jgi:hypothetical protein
LYIADEMMNIHQELSASEEVMKQMFERLCVLTERDSEIGQILAEFMAESSRRDKLLRTLQVHGVRSDDDKEPDALTQEQKTTIIKEMKILEGLTDFGIRRSQDAEDIIDPSFFKDFKENVSEKCPFLTSIIEALVIGSNKSERNTIKRLRKKFYVATMHWPCCLMLGTQTVSMIFPCCLAFYVFHMVLENNL